MEGEGERERERERERGRGRGKENELACITVTMAPHVYMRYIHKREACMQLAPAQSGWKDLAMEVSQTPRQGKREEKDREVGNFERTASKSHTTDKEAMEGQSWHSAYVSKKCFDKLKHPQSLP